MREKLQQLIVELNKNLVGKEDVMKLSLLTMLAGENLILFGPPGTAKSEIARRLSKVFEEEKKQEESSNSREELKPCLYYEYLLTKFTTPEEIFGPLSIKELKEDIFKRNIEGYIPNARIVFLDEIFKANSSILNSLLTIINEKVYHNGNKKESVPLQSLISASNELPIGDNELSALYDRFLVRKQVNYLDDVSGLFEVTDEEFDISEELKITINDLEKIREGAKKVVITKKIEEIIKSIRSDFKKTFEKDNQDIEEQLSDRRFVKILKFLKIVAYTNGRDEVKEGDLRILVNCLWNNPKNVKKINEIIAKNIKGAR